MNTKTIILFIVLTGCVQLATAQQDIFTPWRPTREEVLQRYRDMMLLDSITKNTVFKMRVQANWQADGNSFW
jgi:hypothetical protein